MIAGVLAIAVLSYLAFHRPPPPGLTGSSAAAPSTTTATPTTSTPRSTPRSTPTATTAAKTTEPAEPSRVLVVGDGFTAGSGEAGWPQLVAADLEAGGRSVTVDVAAADGSGYAEPGPQGVTFAQLAADAGAGYDVVVLVGSVSDTAFAADVQAAAEAALRAVATASPDPAVKPSPTTSTLAGSAGSVVFAAVVVDLEVVVVLDVAVDEPAADGVTGVDGSGRCTTR
jgi:hypothetical protein